MDKRVIMTDKAPIPAAPFSQAVRAAGLVFVSGQLPIDPATDTVPESVAEQTAQALGNVRAILESEGLTLAAVVKSMVFLTDMDRFEEMNEVYRAAFGDAPPARSAYQVVRLPRAEAMVEIEVIALADGG